MLLTRTSPGTIVFDEVLSSSPMHFDPECKRKLIDPTREELVAILEKLLQYANSVSEETVIFIYYSGHGMSIKGCLNWVLPCETQERFIEIDEYCS